jgi:hypothetical protein
LSEIRFRINAENVVHEIVDGEVIAIDLANGSYYSLSGCGPVVWDLLSAGAGASEISSALADRFDAEPGAIEAAVDDLLTRLRESDLIVSGAEAAAPAPPPGPARRGSREKFVPPAFERYTDMKDYFLLDPIHEVDPAGWPRPAA